MQLKPQDILVLLKLVAVGHQPWAYNRLAVDLGMSPSEVHACIKRAKAAGLAIDKGGEIVPALSQLEEFIIHGLRYVFVAERGPLTRGMPTAHAAPPLMDKIIDDGEPPPVWPDANGTVRGISFSPLYKAAAFAANNDSMLYGLLALVDAIRGGQNRERNLAIKEIKRSFANYGKNKKP